MITMADVDNNQEQIDSRHVIELIEDLEQEVTDDTITRDDMRDLDTLRALASKGEDYAEDWEYGASLIRFDYFTTYIKDFVSETSGEALENMPEFLRDAIDWEVVAESMMDDYTEFDYEGVTYYTRTKQD